MYVNCLYNLYSSFIY